MANPPLARLITETVGSGWEDDLDRLKGIEAHVDDAGFSEKFAARKRANKALVSNWIGQDFGVKISPDALFDVQIKRIHEYKRQLLNILECIAHWQALRSGAVADPVPRVRIFGGKAAPGYAVAKEIIRLINDVAAVVNNDPQTGDLLKILYPPNYNVSMAERLIPAADLSEQISTAGKEASGTGNMKFMMNGAPTIGTLDGANVEILHEVGAENFFLFGLTAQEVMKRREDPDHARKAIEASQPLQDVLQMIAEGRFSPDEPERYHGLVHRVWHHDYFLVASDFAAYHTAQGAVSAAYADRACWGRMAAMNTARSGFFSSDARSTGLHDGCLGYDACALGLRPQREGGMAETWLGEDTARAIAEGRHGDPFSVLGPHKCAGGWRIAAFVPGADRLWVLGGKKADEAVPYPGIPGLFSHVQARKAAYRLRAEVLGATWEFDDPFALGPVLGEMDEYLLGEGTHKRLWQVLGAHCITHEGVEGVHFAVWAPNAQRVSVVGNFTIWDGRRHPMRRRGPTGVWETFVPGLAEGETYKYEIAGPGGALMPLKADPVGFGSEHPPANASVVRRIGGEFHDADWMATRGARQGIDAPISVYEVHLGSWRRAHRAVGC